jgi:hypothetical protein
VGSQVINLIAGWSGITLGFLTGFLMGIRFHNENWKGGYSSYERRMLRLGHISLIGLGILNILFAVTAAWTTARGLLVLEIASWSFLIGAFTMPLCCLAMARTSRARTLFVVPVISLTVGGVSTLWPLLEALQK